jgi:hypothetical protein
MADRVLKVNAFTTFDLVDASVEGHGFEETAFATLNVHTALDGPEAVALELELDNTDLDHVPPHADRVTLSPAEAERLAGELEAAAARAGGGDE